jgi:hypothetical protein
MIKDGLHMIKFFKNLFSRGNKNIKSAIINDEYGQTIFDVIDSESSPHGCVMYKSKISDWTTIIILYTGGKTNYSDIDWKPHKGFK